MTNEEILKAAQKSQKNMGEYEKVVVRKSIAYGTLLGIAVCTIMFVVEMIIIKRLDFGKPAIIFSIFGVSDMYEGLKIRSKKKKVKGIVELLVAVLGILLYIGAFLV